MILHFQGFIFLVAINFACTQQPDLNSKTVSSPFPYDLYLCYFRKVAQCYDEPNVDDSNEVRLEICYKNIRPRFFEDISLFESIQTNCAENKTCWKTCNDLVKSKRTAIEESKNLSATLLHKLRYSYIDYDDNSFYPLKLNLTWKPVKGATFYVLHVVDLESTWAIGNGELILTTKTNYIFKKLKTLDVCRSFKFRVLAVTADQVGPFSNTEYEPNQNPPDASIILSLVEITVKNYSGEYKVDKDYKNKIGIKLTYSLSDLAMPVLNSDGLNFEKVYIRTMDDVFIELDVDPTFMSAIDRFYLLPKSLLNSGHEILFLRQTYKNACGRTLLANSAVKITFTCNEVINSFCLNKRYKDLMTKSLNDWDAYSPKRSLIQMVESEAGFTINKFNDKINLDDYNSVCEIKTPKDEPDDTFTLKHYEPISYCELSQDSSDEDSDSVADDKNHVSEQKIDFTTPSEEEIKRTITITIDKSTWFLVFKIGVVFLCIIIALIIAGFLYTAMKFVGVKRELLKRNAELPYTDLTKQ